MKFILDGMLGKLTRWLRILGYDVKYSTKLDDLQLILIAKKEKRVLLTKDLRLYETARKKGINAFFMEGKTETDKLEELAAKCKIRLEISMKTTRCPKCNSRIMLMSQDRVLEKVRSHTLLHYRTFWECPKCRQIYWQGSHWPKIQKTLEIAKKTKNLN